MEERRHVAKLAHAKARDIPAENIRNAHTEEQRVDESADHDIPAELGPLREMPVDVQRARRHRQHAEQVILRLGDGAPGPVMKDIARLVVAEVTAEAALARGEDTAHA